MGGEETRASRGSARAAAGFALFAAASIAALAFPLPREPWGHDGPIHAANVRLLSMAIADGDGLPRWLPEANGGLGGPNFRYYSFFSYYPPAVLSLLGVELLDAIRIACRLSIFIGFLGTGLLAWRAFGPGAGLFSPLLALFSPYPLALIQARLALPEYAALSLAPWVLLSLRAWIRAERPLLAIASSVLVALLLCLHNLSLLLWLPFLLAFAILRTRRDGLRKILSGAFPIGAGLLLSSFQFAPSLLELSWIDGARGLLDIEGFSRWALPLAALLSNRPEEGFSARLIPGPLVVAALLVAFGLLIAERWAGRPRRGSAADLWIPLLLAVAALALTTGVAPFLARVFPPLAVLQFPWRYLGPASVFCAIVAGGLFARLPLRLQIAAWIVMAVLGAGLLFARYGRPAAVEYPFAFPGDFSRGVYTGDFENKYLPLGARLVFSPIAESLVVPSGVAVESIEEGRRFVSARLESGAPFEAVVRRYAFPGWRAWIDGERATMEREPLNGEILLRVPAGRHEIRIERGLRAIDLLYALVSMTALVGLIARAFVRRRLLAWIPCGAASIATIAFGLLSEEGFAPPARLRQAMEEDRIEERAAGCGWSVVHYSGNGLEIVRRGFARALNLGPGGSLREGLGVWAAEIEVPSGVEIGLQYRGRILLLCDGKALERKDETERKLDGSSLARIDLGAGTGGPGKHRLVVIASEIERGSAARILCARPGERWKLIPAEWLRPAENRGYEELFRGSATGEAE